MILLLIILVAVPVVATFIPITLNYLAFPPFAAAFFNLIALGFITWSEEYSTWWPILRRGATTEPWPKMYLPDSFIEFRVTGVFVLLMLNGLLSLFATDMVRKEIKKKKKKELEIAALEKEAASWLTQKFASAAPDLKGRNPNTTLIVGPIGVWTLLGNGPKQPFKNGRMLFSMETSRYLPIARISLSIW